MFFIPSLSALTTPISGKWLNLTSSQINVALKKEKCEQLPTMSETYWACVWVHPLHCIFPPDLGSLTLVKVLCI